MFCEGEIGDVRGNRGCSLYFSFFSSIIRVIV